jgi:hypothetical protein
MQVKARLVLASCLTVMATGAVSGCSVFERNLDDGGLPAYTPRPEASNLPAKAVSTGGSESSGSAAAGDLVRSIALRTKDVRNRGLSVDADAAELDGVHLTGCPEVTPGEGHVEAEHRVALLGDSSDGEASLLVSDVVAYDGEGAASDALDEWRDSWSELSACPPGRDATVLGAGDLRAGQGEISGTCDLPAEVCVEVTVALSNADDEKRFTYAVAQRSGGVVAILALQADTEPSEAAKARVLALAKPLGERLVDRT